MDYKGNDFYCGVALKGVLSFQKEYESANVLAFHHTRPYWPIHIVVIPKKHIPSFTDRMDEDESIINEVLQVVWLLAKKIEEEQGAARIVTNLGRYQDSKHLHFHIGSGERLS